MKAIDSIQKKINSIPAGEPFSASLFRHLASADNIKQILSRQVKAGLIKRVARGVYVKPKQVPIIGESLPSVREITEKITQMTGETIVLQGAEAARQLHLTTQVPMRLVFYTNGKSRKLTIANKTITLKHVTPSRLIAAGTMAGTVISALMHLGKENVTTQIIEKIHNQITQKEFQSVLSEIQNMPVWLSDVFYHYKKGENNE